MQKSYPVVLSKKVYPTSLELLKTPALTKPTTIQKSAHRIISVRTVVALSGKTNLKAETKHYSIQNVCWKLSREIRSQQKFYHRQTVSKTTKSLGILCKHKSWSCVLQCGLQTDFSQQYMNWPRSDVQRKKTWPSRSYLQPCLRTHSHDLHRQDWVKFSWPHKITIAAFFVFIFKQ